ALGNPTWRACYWVRCSHSCEAPPCQSRSSARIFHLRTASAPHQARARDTPVPASDRHGRSVSLYAFDPRISGSPQNLPELGPYQDYVYLEGHLWGGCEANSLQTPLVPRAACFGLCHSHCLLLIPEVIFHAYHRQACPV